MVCQKTDSEGYWQSYCGFPEIELSKVKTKSDAENGTNLDFGIFGIGETRRFQWCKWNIFDVDISSGNVVLDSVSIKA